MKKENNTNIIEIKNFSKTFKKQKVINNISFNVSKGSIHGFIGPNGSGKTTTIKTLIGAYILKEGTIKINNFPCGSIEAKKLIGYIPERAPFPSYLNAYDYLISICMLSNIKKEKAKEIVEEQLKKFNLWEFRDKYPIKFSSGMQKKMLLIQALLNNPIILILDEPAANLDPIARKELFDIILQLSKEGKTIFISSHILSELEKIINEITFIYYGKVLYNGKIDKLLQESKTLIVKTNKNQEVLNYLKEKFPSLITSLTNDNLVLDKIKDEKEIIESILNINEIKIYEISQNNLLNIYLKLIEKEKSLN